MFKVLNFLFPEKPDRTSVSLLLLAARVILGVLLMNHGLHKLMDFEAMSARFPDPLGVGGTVSLSLAIFGELACSLGFVVGAFYRLALIPMIFTMCVALGTAHGWDIFGGGELAFVYLAMFVLMYIAGPGKFALDRIIAVSLRKKR